jgi:rubrerythrin
MRTINSPGELYAHAIALEREAAERYAEFARRMDDLGNAAAAEVFTTLARLEEEHLQTLLERTQGVRVPEVLEEQYAWLDAGAPETTARELVFRLLTARQALDIALRAERRAQTFFEKVMLTADDPALRALAREMAAEEGEHIGLVEQLLDQTRQPGLDAQVIFGR